MITADQCIHAADLIAEREAITEPLSRMLQAKRVRIQYEGEYLYVDTDDGKAKHHRFDWINGPEVTVDAGIRRLLIAGAMADLARIDEQLRALGVEPPADEFAEGARKKGAER